MYTAKYHKFRYFFLGFLLATTFLSCSREKFASLNTDPDAVLNINLAYELTPGEMDIHSNDFEVFYDFYRDIKPWTQEYVNSIGNQATFMTGGSSNINARWGNFYGGVGNNLEDVVHKIEAMPADQQAQNQTLYAITLIPLAYYAFYTSDPNGSIPYSQAFLSRYTDPPLFTPIYDPQATLFDSLDVQLQKAISILEANPTVTQTTVGANDLYYQGDPTHWIKAANSLRLKMAMRLMKRNPAKLTAIATAVFNDKIGVIGSIADDWIFYSTTVGNGDNSNPLNQQNFSGEYNVVNFMWKVQDPRLRIFYQQSGINTKDLFDSAQAQGVIPASVAWDGQPYRGQFASPAATQDASKGFYFQTLNFSYKGIAQSLHYPSIIQGALTSYVLNAPTGGINMFPVITYADVCFMRAEMKLRGLSTNDPESADSLYYQGVRASLMNYDQWGKNTLLKDYTALTADEMNAYLASTGVKYDPANALEQVCDQEYLNFFVNANEAWALIKRTGYPSATGHIMPLEDVSAYGKMPRRYQPIQPALGDLNYNNVTNAIDSMALDPNYSVPTDMTGRVWWDQP